MSDLQGQFVASLPEDLQIGDPTLFSCRVSSVELTDGTTFTPPASGVTVVVGPNNAGKSTLLKEIHAALGRAPSELTAPGRVAAEVELTTTGSQADAIAWLLRHSRAGRFQGGEVLLMPLGPGSALGPAWCSIDLPSRLQQSRLGNDLRAFLVHYADTEARLQQSQAAGARADAREPATHPLHVLEDDRRRLTRASDLAMQVFDEPLHLDDYSAARRLKVGRISLPAPSRDAEGSEYRDALLALPELAEQGDGMRSFFGQLLPLLARAYQVVLVDEPEAFLHPPQAALLGEALGALVQDTGTQLFLATHDRRLLGGLLSSGTPLSVLRLDRPDGGFRGRHVTGSELEAVWSDASVRYSNALDGLFHRLVVLVEGDGDARFFSAALDVASEQRELPFAPSDVLFVPCNGKGGMAKIARALVNLGVPVVASPDLDVLQKPGELRALLEALGGSWIDVASDYAAAVGGLSKLASPLVVSDILDVLPKEGTARLDEELRQKVARLLRTTGAGWSALKDGGLGVIGGGGPGAAAERLLSRLAASGLVALRQGQLESFDHGLGVAKPRWVQAALESDVHRKAEPIAHVCKLIDVGAGR